MSENVFPRIIQTVLYYVNIDDSEFSKLVIKINDKLLALVLTVMKTDIDFGNIMHRLKHSFKTSYPKTKELIIMWFTELFKNYSEDMIQHNDEVLENIIETLNFDETSVSDCSLIFQLVKKILELLCLMCRKYEKFLKEIVDKLLKRFLNNSD